MSKQKSEGVQIKDKGMLLLISLKTLAKDQSLF